jgi:hypothetical protein
MIIDKIAERFLSIYLLVSGLVVLSGIDFNFYANNFSENSRFPLMDIMYLVFYSLFIVAGIMGLFFNKELLTKVLVYLTLFTISVSGFNYLLTGTVSFVVGIYLQETLMFVTDYRSYGGFSFYYTSEESGIYGIGINITSLVLIVYYHLRKRLMDPNINLVP